MGSSNSYTVTVTATSPLEDTHIRSKHDQRHGGAIIIRPRTTSAFSIKQPCVYENVSHIACRHNMHRPYDDFGKQLHFKTYIPRKPHNIWGRGLFPGGLTARVIRNMFVSSYVAL